MKKKKEILNQSVSQTSILLNKKFKIILFLIVSIIAISYFSFVLLSNYTVRYLSVLETINLETDSEKYLGVSGKLVENSYYKDVDGLTDHFSIKDEDNNNRMKVIYRGDIGQLFFNKHSELILQGHKQNNGIFYAENLTVKCPSKYITEQEKNEISPPYEEESSKKQI